MRIVFYNINDGKTDLNGLLKYLESLIPSTDVFCFQEVYEDVEKPILNLFTEFRKADSHENSLKGNLFTQGTFIKKTNELVNTKRILPDIHSAGLGLYTEFDHHNKRFSVMNIHGIPQPGDKLDTEERIAQSQAVLDCAKDLSLPIITGGDFNLLPNTKSIEMFSDNGFRNLITENNIKSTRNQVAWKKYPDNKQMFADFTFINAKVEVVNFEVPYNEYSDHLPMILDIKD